MRWPMLARDTEAGLVMAALDGSECRGVVLVGESGVGKSTLARGLADAVAARGCPVRYVLGTRAGMGVPLGAFSQVVTVDAATDLAAMLAGARTVLARQQKLVIVIDDAQLLDSLSATLVHQLAIEHAARLIVTIRSGVPVPDAVADLLQESWLAEIVVPPVSREQTAQLARAVLGDAVESPVIDELYARTAGNLLFLRGLLTSGLSAGTVEPGTELATSVDHLLRSLDAEELAVVEVVATAEVLERPILEQLCSPGAVERLQRSGMIGLIGDGPEAVVQLHHPVIGEVLSQRIGVVRSRQLNGMLARAYQRHLADGGDGLRLPDERGQIRLAQFMMRSDLSPDPALAVRAARSALALADMATGEQLSRYALDHGGGLPAALLLADALHWRGRNDDAEAVLIQFDPAGDHPAMAAHWAGLRAVSLFDAGRCVAAREVLDTMRQRIGTDPAADIVTAAEITLTFYSGDFATAIERGRAICATSTQRLALTRSAAPAAWALALSGRFAELDDVAQAVRRAGETGTSGMQRLLVGLAQTVAAAGAGELSTAQEMLDAHADLAAGVPERLAVIAAISGYVQTIRGDVTAAAAAMQRAMAGVSAGFQPVMVAMLLAWWVQAEAQRGESGTATTVLRRAEGGYDERAAAFLPDLELARAWVAAGAGETSSAQRHAVLAARTARRRGADVVEMHALHAGVRFGDRGHAARLSDLAAGLSTPLAQAIADHARGLAEYDGDLLDAAADRFRVLGALAAAADAAAQAAREHARHGRRAEERESSRRARDWAAETGLRSPAIKAIAAPLPITDREREIAALVADGLSNREVADRLGVSVRTVDGHLYRIFGKLNVQGREQLQEVLVGKVRPGCPKV